jgi:hypothetical protein
MKSQTRAESSETTLSSEEITDADAAPLASRSLDHRLLDGRNATAEANEREIRELAYYLWLEEGCPDGRHLEHWERATAMLVGPER